MNNLPKVLLVDDEEDQLNLLTAILRKNGFDVFSLSNPAEIPSILKTFTPDLILLDVRLGKYDGREICKKLKADDLSKSVIIILHSAFPEIQEEYKLCGADEFIIKPTNALDLISRLKFHLQ